MSVDNVLINNVNQTNPNQKRKSNSALPYTVGAATLGLVGGGAYGYTRNQLVNKDGFYTDEFIKKVASDFAPMDVAKQQRIQQTATEFIQMFPDPRRHLVEKLEETGVFGNFKELDDAGKKAVLEIIDLPKIHTRDFQQFLRRNADVIGIVPEKGQTMNEAIKAYMKERPKEVLKQMNFEDTMKDDIFKNLLSKVDKKTGQRVPTSSNALRIAIEQDIQAADNFFVDGIKAHMDTDWMSKFIDIVYDRKAKKFKAVSEEAPKELMDSIKKAAGEISSPKIKLRTAAMYGGMAALAVGVGSFISSLLTRKSS